MRVRVEKVDVLGWTKSTEKYNNMVVAKEQTKTYPKDTKILALTTCLSKLQGNQLYVLAAVQLVGGKRTQARTNTHTKLRDPKNSYVEGLK